MSNLVDGLQLLLFLDGSMYSGRFVFLFNLCFPLALLVNGIHSTKNILVDTLEVFFLHPEKSL